MNILVVIPYIDKKWGGIFQYTQSVLRSFVRDKENTYFLYITKPNQDILLIADEGTNFHVIKESETIEASIKKKLFDFFSELSILFLKFNRKFPRIISPPIEKIIKKYNIQLLYCTFEYYIPTSKPYICTVHDLQELHYPEYFSSLERLGRAENKHKVIQQSWHIITSYNHIKDDIIKYFHVTPEKITVNRFDLKYHWVNFCTDNQKFVNNISFTLPKKYLLYPAATWPHKNHIMLLEAIKILKNSIPDIFLICTGHQTNYFNTIIKPKIDDLNLNSNIIFTGIIEEQDLYFLYKKCCGVVIPTKYEAGSFPLYESILLGVPVICSNVTSLPETICNGKFMFDPDDINDIVDKINALWNDTSFRNLNKKNSSKISSLLFQDNYLKRFVEILEKIK